MFRKHDEHLLPHDPTLHTRGGRLVRGRRPRRIPCSPSAHLSIVDIVDFIKDDPLQVSDDVGATVQHGAGQRKLRLTLAASSVTTRLLRGDSLPTQNPLGDRALSHRRISVVMMRQEASGCSCTSPVSSPTSPNVFRKSRNFWLLRALIGEV